MRGIVISDCISHRDVKKKHSTLIIGFNNNLPAVKVEHERAPNGIKYWFLSVIKEEEPSKELEKTFISIQQLLLYFNDSYTFFLFDDVVELIKYIL